MLYERLHTGSFLLYRLTCISTLEHDPTNPAHLPFVSVLALRSVLCFAVLRLLPQFVAAGDNPASCQSLLPQLPAANAGTLRLLMQVCVEPLTDRHIQFSVSVTTADVDLGP